MQISISNAIGGGGGTQGGGTPTPPPFSNVNSFLFDGVDEKMFSTANYTEINGTQNFSVSFWLKPIDSNDGLVFRFGTQGSTNRLACIYYPSLEIVIISFGTSSYYYRSVNGSIPLNQWSHIVYTYNGTQSRYNRPEIYVNGVLSQGTNNGVINSQSYFDGTLELGGTGTSGQQNFGNNYIDEFAVWNSTTLTQTQANELYNSGTPSDLNNIASGLAQPTTWFRMGEEATWNGKTWTMTDVNGVYTNRSVSMVEANRTTNVPTPPPFSNTKSILLDGVDDFVTMGNVYDQANDGSGTFSTSLWIKTSLSSLGYLVSKQTGFTDGYGVFMLPAGAIAFYLGTSSGSARIYKYTQNTFNNGAWYNIVVTYDGSQDVSGVNIYVNGSLQTCTTVTNNTPSNVSNVGDFTLGRRNGDTYPFDGLIDEVGFWNGTELTSVQANAIYNLGTPTSLSTYNPSSYWRCGDGDTAPTLTDNGSGGNDGTMTNFSTFSTDVPSSFTNTKSILLDGVDDYVSFSQVTYTDEFTTSFWIKPINLGASFLVGRDTSSDYVWLRTVSQIRVRVNFSTYSFIESGGNDINANAWNHLLICRDSSNNLRIFLNGAIFASSQVAAGQHRLDQIGKVGTSYYDGNVDETAFWDSDQSSNLATIYNSGVPNDISSLSPTLWYRMGDGDTSPTLTDNGSGGNDGTMTNFTTFSTDVPT